MKTTAIIAACLIQCSSAFGQGEASVRPGRWQTLTDMRSVRALASVGGVGWAATQGGLFRWESQKEPMTKYTNSEGLSANDLTAVMIDPDGRVWVGASDGSVNVLEPGSSRWIAIDAIKQSTPTQKSIRTFSMSGDSLLIGTDFGVSVFRLSRWEFGDTYANFGFPTSAAVNAVVVLDDRLWVATSQGVATAERFLPNLSAPTNWTRYQTAQGLPANNVIDAVMFHDTLVAGTTAGIGYFNGVSFQQIASASGWEIAALAARSDELRALVSTGGYELRTFNGLGGNSVISAQHGSHIPSAIAYDAAVSSWFVGTSDDGIDEWSATPRSIVPNGPFGNLFSSLVVDDLGVLWYATGISGRGNGFGRYNPSLPDSLQWKYFRSSEYPVMVSNDYYKVSRGLNNRIWASSWGKGAIEVRGDSIGRKIDTGSIPSFYTSDNSDPFYPVVNGVAVDGDGQTWFVNWAARNGQFVAQLTSDSTFSYHTSPLIFSGLLTSLVIDGNGTKWFANSEPFHPAKGLYLYYLNEDKVVSGTASTNGWGLMAESDGLPDNIVMSLAVDFDGSVCVGTDHGMMIISDPLFPLQRHFTSFPLREQSIQALTVDALNNKWVGTKEGVFVMNSDATQILQQYTVTSTGGRLVDNDIRALVIDQKRGIAYIGTEKGISSISVEAVLPVRSSTELTLGPNPFILPAANSLVIGNLVAESSIKILTLGGSLITEFKAQGGGRAFWDGRDKKGNLVGSGVYFVVAFAENGDQVASGKIAVVRK